MDKFVLVCFLSLFIFVANISVMKAVWDNGYTVNAFAKRSWVRAYRICSLLVCVLCVSSVLFQYHSALECAGVYNFGEFLVHTIEGMAYTISIVFRISLGLTLLDVCLLTLIVRCLTDSRRVRIFHLFILTLFSVFHLYIAYRTGATIFLPYEFHDM